MTRSLHSLDGVVRRSQNTLTHLVANSFRSGDHSTRIWSVGRYWGAACRLHSSPGYGLSSFLACPSGDGSSFGSTGCSGARLWEDDRVIVRCRLRSLIGLGCLITTLSGCSDRFLAGPLQYVDNDALTKEVKGKTSLAGKLKLQDKVRKDLAKLYGENPKKIVVPEGMGVLLTGAGARLANYQQVGESIKRNVGADGKQIAGGFAIYRRNCLHCHGVSGAGDGPTAAFLYPPPRDYRRGLFKFTSTPNGARPTRDDLMRTIKNGLHGTSMPSFEALLSDDEIAQAVDYVIFLSVRGETELELIDIGATSDENDINSLSMDDAHEAAGG